jgi:hypothetical protein
MKAVTIDGPISRREPGLFFRTRRQSTLWHYSPPRVHDAACGVKLRWLRAHLEDSIEAGSRICQKCFVALVTQEMSE